ncbi:MAG: hypothetical protein QW782_00925, partial [Candidatus Bathyarchaeia archaeon]
IAKGHPVVKRWDAKAAEEAVKAAVEEAKLPTPAVTAQIQAPAAGLTVPAGVGGFRLSLKNVKIHAKKVRIIRAKEG